VRISTWYILGVACIAAMSVPAAASAQSAGFYDPAMQWREIGPTRAGRARAVVGVPSEPNVAYIGFDNGGVWRSTDYGSTWHPLFDHEPTGSIGAIAVSPSDPNIIYVGSGAGIIRPDLATGDGMYKSTDAGKTWTHLGLRNTQMIAQVEVDPKNPDRVFVAALGHPYGPNPERGVFRSLDGGKTFEKVLYKDEYTSAADVRIDPADPNIVYATLWQQQQGYSENTEFGGPGGGIYKSTDGGTTWHELTNGLPDIIQANLAIAPSDPNILYAAIAGVAQAGGRGGRGSTTGVVGLFKSTDGGEHWFRAIDGPDGSGRGRVEDPRPMVRIGGGDLPTLAVDPKNPDVLYSCSTVFWRSEDGGITWTAVRGAPGGDDYQKTWINPTNPNIILLVADQGGVVSANRGKSWSNWYTQPTAAMYHVTTDDAFPYRVCGGQQDSGSACVDSRSMDGEITFNAWHPVNIQEYGIAAPDPNDPDLVYGSSRSNVSLYDRKTGQTTNVGPDQSGTGPNGDTFDRNVRTMPIIWSPVDHKTLYYVSDVVWKTTDHAHSWTRISPDLARQTWTVPPSVGKYASDVRVSPQGTITALAPSPRAINTLWAGTDDGNVQVTTDGGKTWHNVTPPAIKPWTRIFNIDAGHFDTQTAYVAANTMRLDDMNPHFFRTHDGGKTWTEIDNGIAPGAVANSIREDPHVKGLLYGATDTQVWVSFDDGDHWHSLRLNMPAISVRDIEVKDDATCLCSDLVAGTHGRGFWILDDLTPLRQAAEVARAKEAYLFRPATAVRVRFGTNDPTPWPPEVAAGQNPPPGGIIDYYLAHDVSGPVSLEILDHAGRLVRSYASTDPVLDPDPAADPEAYNTQVCQQNPRAADCSVPLYWAAPQMSISTRAGMHRFSWDLHFNPIGGNAEPQGEGGATGAVPHRTYPGVNAPWAPAGQYTVRLTVGGKTYTQPLTLKLDPRVKTSPAALAQLASLSREMYDGAQSAHAAYTRARGLVAALDKLSGADVEAFRKEVEALAPAAPAGGRGRGFGFGRGGRGNTPATLETLPNTMMGAAMAMQGADVAPTATEIAACAHAGTESRDVMARWTKLSTSALAAFNAKRRAAGQSTVSLPGAD
jgi:photosystem II stability/assembly factor-like uncharacterized protein